MDSNLPLVNAWISKAKHDIGMAKLAITDGCEFTIYVIIANNILKKS